MWPAENSALAIGFSVGRTLGCQAWETRAAMPAVEEPPTDPGAGTGDDVAAGGAAAGDGVASSGAEPAAAEPDSAAAAGAGGAIGVAASGVVVGPEGDATGAGATESRRARPPS